MGIELFHKLSHEKQAEILAASLAEFAAYGFDLASTNRIVERAGISKGVLFKYFASKESLLLYLVEREAAAEQAANEELLQSLPADFFAALRHLAVGELSRREAHPDRYALFEQVLEGAGHPVYDRAGALLARAAGEVYARLAEALQGSSLRPGVPFDRVMNLVSWVSDGVKRQYRGRRVDAEAVLADLDAYFDLLRQGLGP